jgi:hypothetical protein
MKLYQNINLDCTSLIQKYVGNYKDWAVGSAHYMKLPDSIISVLDDELKSRDLPKSCGAVVFRRFNSPFDPNTCHTDARENGTKHELSIIIPIVGCEGTRQYWFDGKFHMERKLTLGNVLYDHIVWDDEPIFLGDVEIYKNPIISRANIPHSVQSDNNQYRITYTFRFPEGTTFDEVCEKFK